MKPKAISLSAFTLLEIMIVVAIIGLLAPHLTCRINFLARRIHTLSRLR